MKAVVQRVNRASVRVDGQERGTIDHGLVVLLGVAVDDTQQDAARLVDQILKLRIFSDEHGKMNRSLTDVQGGMMVVSQFTLFADTSKGNRPSFFGAAPPEPGRALYDKFVEHVRASVPATATGEFGAQMEVELVNDGPVTIVLDTRTPLLRKEG
ncbi:MAG: D-tyrosyl-tRNA(Tyr) deacylase [Candidatus Kerfeldbacteria bacterium]|nr:D-tyrosyl-tRNA(Tyr) deacylase [Candidatus Kerfeldbacteria bacterium]